jgi:hypothetical protein
MAMGRDSITQCRSDVAYFNNSWENPNYKAVFDSIQGDPEYSKFIEQTDLGKELNTKLGAMLDLYGSLWNTLGELGDKTRSFLNVQEALNSSSMNYGSSAGVSTPPYNPNGGGNYDIPPYNPNTPPSYTNYAPDWTTEGFTHGKASTSSDVIYGGEQ